MLWEEGKSEGRKNLLRAGTGARTRSRSRPRNPSGVLPLLTTAALAKRGTPSALTSLSATLQVPGRVYSEHMGRR